MNKNTVNVLVVTVLLLLVMLLVANSVASNTGMMSYLVKFIGGSLALCAFFKPKFGAYVLLFEAFLVDAIKRYAVYFGTSSMDTIIEVMVVQMLAVSALITVAFIKIMTGEARFKWPIFSFFILGLICAGGSLVLSKDGLSSSVKDAFNLGAYIALVFVFYHLFVDLGLKVKPFFDTMLCLAVASSVIALRQSFFGFSDVEDYYMHTWLSPVASGHYLLELDQGNVPRGFGLASGVMNFVSMSGLAIYAYFSSSSTKKVLYKVLYILAYFLICFALIKVRMKTGVAIALCAPFAIYIARFSKILYASAVLGIVGFGVLVFNSVELRDSIAVIDYAFRGTVGLSEQYTIQTFEARLHSYSMMLDMDNWTPFGIGGHVEAHDIITLILLKFGYIPLIIMLMAMASGFVLFVKKSSKLAPNARYTYMGFLVMFGLLFMANIVGGSNLHTNPVNFVLCTSIAAVLALGWPSSGLNVEAEENYSEDQ